MMQHEYKGNQITLIKMFTAGKIDYYGYKVYVKGKLYCKSPAGKHYSKDMAISKAKEEITNLKLDW